MVVVVFFVCRPGGTQQLEGAIRRVDVAAAALLFVRRRRRRVEEGGPHAAIVTSMRLRTKIIPEVSMALVFLFFCQWMSLD